MSFIGQTTVATAAPDLVIPNVPAASDVTIGDWVRMQNGIAVKAIADDINNSNVIGLVEFKGATTVNIRVLGVSAPIFSGLDETKEYYLSDLSAGQMGLTAPVGTGHVVLKVGQPYSPTQFLVFKGLRLVRS